uniref:Uncharacterized protein n=1 Tax=Babesia gibsoni TaxID=33632 RepID=A0A6M8P1Y6_BABGI|nr:hypothetical protein [Babesia gibsoni]
MNINKLKITYINKLHKVYKLNILKKNINIGHTNYNLKIYLNNKYLLNKFLKLNTSLSKHCYTNLLCNKYKI